ncbi:uncharacterized mitochondrial protein AtMg00810-like [Lycium barbarum]|uniref:uncharacterized mitochondrial protein AtMg00810-like n=1 Tax=Lycium barbarum TaxID=112863 RepID=UPI00293E812C|nr:uncharacterized mitochondrial protein AtMg00810-like [Lycium barbarum]
MSQPLGFVDQKYPEHVCLLKKALYGLKQAPRAWLERFSLYLLHLGFKCSRAYSSLFTLHSSEGTILLLLYVDDIIVTGSNSKQMDVIVRKLGTEFAMKDLGQLSFFLGVEVNYFPGVIHLNQHKYANDLLKKVDMTNIKVVHTPLAQKHGLQETVGTAVDPSLYRSIVGSLQYLTLTRPDIIHAVNLASQFMQNPNSVHLQAVKRILRYVKGTISYGLCITSQYSFRLYGFSDADWAGCATTRRSTTGYSIYLGANCVSWSSRKQNTVARSSAEAEYRALAATTTELTWITYILQDIGIYVKSAPTLFCDNMSALYMTTNPVLHARTKHIELDYHFVREKVAQGQLVTQFVRSKDQLVDVHTKALPKDRFRFFRDKLRVVHAPPLSLRGSVEDHDRDDHDKVHDRIS